MSTPSFKTARTSFKAFAFGIGATLAIAVSLLHVQDQREQRAAVITLDPVVITAKREQLPTVYITGRRDTAATASSWLRPRRPAARPSSAELRRLRCQGGDRDGPAVAIAHENARQLPGVLLFVGEFSW